MKQLVRKQMQKFKGRRNNRSWLVSTYSQILEKQKAEMAMQFSL